MTVLCQQPLDGATGPETGSSRSAALPGLLLGSSHPSFWGSSRQHRGGWVLPGQPLWIASRRINAALSEKEKFLLSLHARTGAVTWHLKVLGPFRAPADSLDLTARGLGCDSPCQMQPNACVQLFLFFKEPKKQSRGGEKAAFLLVASLFCGCSWG